MANFGSIFKQFFGGENGPFNSPQDSGFGVPGAGTNPASQGGLVMTSHADLVRDGVSFTYRQVYPPTVPMANDGRVKYLPRFRYLIFGGNGVASGTNATQTFGFSCPTIIVARVAAAIDASGAGLPVGRNPLDCFTSQMFTTGTFQDFLDAGAGGNSNTAPNTEVLGSVLYGSAGLPALMPAHGRLFDTGYFLSTSLTTNRANIEAHVGIFTIEEIATPRMG